MTLGRRPSARHAGIMTTDSKVAHDPVAPHRPVVSTGNPRVTVAFPFSKIELREPSDQVRDLAAIVLALADQVAALASQAAPSQVEAAEQVAAEASLLAERVRAVSVRSAR